MTEGGKPYFVFRVSHSRSEGNWTYRLVPLADFDESNLDPETSKTLGHIKKGVSFQKNSVELSACIPELVSYLRDSMKKCREQEKLRPLSFSFRDEVFFWQADDNLYRTVVHIDLKLTDDFSYEAIYVLYASLYLYLSGFPEHTSITRVYLAWQRYSIIKKIYEREYEHQQGICKNISHDTADRLEARKERIRRGILGHEFTSAYRSLTNLLLDDAHSYACRILWMEGSKKRMLQPKKTSTARINSRIASKAPDIPSDPRIRQELRISMLLTSSRDDTFHPEPQIPLERPLPAPVCFKNNMKVSFLSGIKLHPRFRETTGQSAVRRLIHEELLPQYDLKWILLLTKFLARFGRHRKWLRCCGPLNCLIPKVVMITFILTLLLTVWCSFTLDWPNWMGIIAPYWISIAIVVVFIGGLLGLGVQSGITLLLPRVTGGITIGYLPLLMTEESWRLVLYSSQNQMVWLFGWITVLSMVWIYLCREAYPPVLDSWEAAKRSFKVLIWAVVQAVLIGYMLILVSTIIYNEVNPASQTMDGLAFLVDLPLLWVKFPLSALLTFAPISLLLGLILQILWQEKPVTASVWPPESR